MADIHEPSEEPQDDLQFHLELEDEPLSNPLTRSPPVPRFSFSLKLSAPLPPRFANAGPGAVKQADSEDSPVQAEPCSSEASSADSDDSDGSEAMALQAAETLNRTFLELRSKDNDTRLRASYDLNNQVNIAVRGKAFGRPAVCS